MYNFGSQLPCNPPRSPPPCPTGWSPPPQRSFQPQFKCSSSCVSRNIVKNLKNILKCSASKFGYYCFPKLHHSSITHLADLGQLNVISFYFLSPLIKRSYSHFEPTLEPTNNQPLLLAAVSNYLDTRRYRGQNNSRDPLQNNWLPSTAESSMVQLENRKWRKNHLHRNSSK